jgi:BirA family biotin operon repressor/biotin-[acetyl-CoA-carboxylase] ligase
MAFGRSAHREWTTLVPFGTDVRYFDECDSTNTVAVSAGTDGETGPIWFVAGQQTAGRGRRGNVWNSYDQNLYSSYLFRPKVALTDLAALPFVVSLAVRDTFIALGCDEDDVKCKWPNDVLIDEKKANGILIETSAASGHQSDFVVIGIGLNLNGYPKDTLFPSTSVSQQLSCKIDVASAFKVLSHVMDIRLSKWFPSDISAITEEWSSKAWGIGTRREIRTTNDTFTGTLVRLETDGGLLVKLDDGTEKRLYAGDIFNTIATS